MKEDKIRSLHVIMKDLKMEDILQSVIAVALVREEMAIANEVLAILNIQKENNEKKLWLQI